MKIILNSLPAELCFATVQWGIEHFIVQSSDRRTCRAKLGITVYYVSALRTELGNFAIILCSMIHVTVTQSVSNVPSLT